VRGEVMQAGLIMVIIDHGDGHERGAFSHSPTCLGKLVALYV
jgi:hypothetical protein